MGRWGSWGDGEVGEMGKMGEKNSILNVNNSKILVVRLAKPCRRLCILLATWSILLATWSILFATNTQFRCMTAYPNNQVSTTVLLIG